MTILDFVGTAPTIRPGIAMIQLHDALWRITRLNGEVLGYIERLNEPAGHRFRAKRLLPRQRRFLPIGDFWTIDDAIDCFRF